MLAGAWVSNRWLQEDLGMGYAAIWKIMNTMKVSSVRPMIYISLVRLTTNAEYAPIFIFKIIFPFRLPK